MILSTYRLQLHKDFTFDDAAARVPYLRALGISHVYSSPVFTARPSSMHGYDVVNPLAINPELGGRPGLERLCAALKDHGMGLMVDFVPNHMAVGGRHNAWWLDVLRWGKDSIYSGFFDIDWEADDPAIRGKVLAPFLGQPYGDALAAGEITLQADTDSGELYFGYFDHVFPLAPQDYAEVLRRGPPSLAASAPAFDLSLQSRARSVRRERFQEALAQLRRNTTPEDLTALAQSFDPASEAGRAALHQLLQRQHYRLCWWRCASDEINWRRFFDVIDLAGIRVQDAAVFAATHAGLLELVDSGLVDGVRIDHIDGLAQPGPYCRQLRRRMQQSGGKNPQTRSKERVRLYVEKILASGEQVPPDWRTDGSTGYDFMNEVGAVLHDPAGEAPLSALWTTLTGRTTSFEAEEKVARRRIPSELLRSDFNACAAAFHRLARSRIDSRDITLEMIRRVLAEVLVHFPVYRTYIGATGRSAADDMIIRETLAKAGESCRPGDRVVIPRLDRWLGGEPASAIRSATLRRLHLRALDRFQQLTSPVAAKSVEDTAFYRHGSLLSRNEVGASPSIFSIDPQGFHATAAARLQQYPEALLATATHDHKRGEDLRIRLSVLSEMPEEWAAFALHWRAGNEGCKSMVNGALAPDAADEYMLYQMILGAWPMSLTQPSAQQIEDLRERLGQWQVKAIREAKRQSGWLEPNLEYESAAAAFLKCILDPQRSQAFLDDMHRAAMKIMPAGAVKSLSQLALKLGAPGIPDTYQGCEFWDLSMVDPDNRRPVDFDAREAALTAFQSPHQLLAHWPDGRLKQNLLSLMLRLRHCFPELMLKGDYEPLSFEGPLALRFIGFMRTTPQQCMAVIAPLYPLSMEVDDGLRLTAPALAQTAAVPPRAMARRTWLNLLAPEATMTPAASWALHQLLERWPLAVLIDSAMFEPCFHP